MRTFLIYFKVTPEARPPNVQIIMCTEYKWKSLDFQPRLFLKISRIFPIYLLLYGTHHLGIKLLSLFKWKSCMNPSIPFLSFRSFFFFDNNRNIILILCQSRKQKKRKLVVGTMLFYTDMKFSLVTLSSVNIKQIYGAAKSE